MQKELNEAGAQGYRLLSRAISAKGGCCGGAIVAITELAPGETRRYEYKWLAAGRTSTFQTEVTELVEAGFVIAGLSGHSMVIMERQVE